jgi:hypothetical protein
LNGSLGPTRVLSDLSLLVGGAQHGYARKNDQ